MPGLISKELKALLVVEDITEQGVNVWQDNCFTVQHFHYECRRRRDERGVPYGPTQTSFLDFSVRVSSNESGKAFFERMKVDEPFPYSFLFNALFDSQRHLSEFEDALVVRGYIVDAEESFGENAGEQMLVHARLLICNLAYLSRESVLNLTLTND